MDTSTTRSGRHPVNITHLVMGLAFLGIVASWAIIQAGLVASTDIQWLLPWPWVAAGAAGLVATVVAGRRTRTNDHSRAQQGGGHPDEEELA